MLEFIQRSDRASGRSARGVEAENLPSHVSTHADRTQGKTMKALFAFLLRAGIYALLALFAAVPIAANASSSSSANFQMQIQALNNGGASSTSANFRSDNTVGEGTSGGTGTSANFNNKPGFQPGAHMAAIAPTITSTNNVTFTVNSLGTFTVTATGNPIPTFSVAGALPTGVTFDTNTGVLSGTPASGTAGNYPLVITATNGNLPDAQQNFTLTVNKVNQTLTFGPQSNQTYAPGGIFTLNPLASSTSGLAPAYSSLTTGVCTVSGINVTIVTAGTCTIAADQAGDGVHNPAAQVTQSINIAKANQSITFPAIGNQTFNLSPLTISATSSSALTVAFTSATTGVCTVAGTSVTFVSVGTCTINADQPGNLNYNAAPQVPRSFSVLLGVQTISFAPLPNRIIGSIFTVAATASSGLVVSFATQTPATCLTTGVNGSFVTLIGTGTCTIRATQAGNANYGAATPVNQSFNVNFPITAIVLSSSVNPVSYGSPIVLSANVVGNNPTGTVTFTASTLIGNVTLCSAVPLVSGTAACTVPGSFNKFPVVPYTGTYSGDANNPSVATTYLQFVTLTGISLSASANPQQPAAGRPVTLRAMVTASSFTGGTVTFYENGVALPGCAAVTVATLPGSTDTGIAVCNLSGITAGNHTYVVNYPHTTDAGFEQVYLPVTVLAGAPADYSDMWWAGLPENGWGISIAQHGNVQFNVFFVYDAAGKPVWYVMPGGSWDAAQKAYTGVLYQPTSTPFTAYDATQFKPGAIIGTATIAYSSDSSATVSYTINGVSGTKNIVRQPFAGEDGLPKLQVADMWWGGIAQNGWGMNIAQHGRTLFPVWYTYSASGTVTWYAVPGGTWSGNTFTGDIYSTVSSGWLGVPYNVGSFVATKVGSMSLTFSDQGNATMTYTVDGVTQTKSIVRMEY